MEREKTKSKDEKSEKKEIKSLKAVSKLLPGLGKFLGFFAKPVIKANRKSVKHTPNIPGVKQIKQLRGMDVNKKQNKENVGKKVNQTKTTHKERSKSGSVEFSTSAKHSSKHTAVNFKKFGEISGTAAKLSEQTKAMKSKMKTVAKPNTIIKKAATSLKPLRK